MKNYIVKVVAFLCGICIIVGICIFVSPVNQVSNHIFSVLSNSEDFTRSEEEAKIKSIADAKNPNNGYTKLLAGDSVCWMLFTRLQEYNDDYLIAAASRPFTIAGQYVVVKEFIENHPDATDVYLMLSKDDWQAVLDVQCGYQNVAVPIKETDTWDDLDANTKEELQQLFGDFLLRPQVVTTYDYSNMNRKIVLNGVRMYHEKVLHEDVSAQYEETKDEFSPIAKQYFEKIIQICEENGVALHLLHDPQADTEENHNKLEVEKKMFEEAGYAEIASDYLTKVMWCPEEQFYDGIHFGGTEAEQDVVIQKYVEFLNEMSDLKLK